MSEEVAPDPPLSADEERIAGSLSAAMRTQGIAQVVHQRKKRGAEHLLTTARPPAP